MSVRKWQGSTRRRGRGTEEAYWPGFVDAMAQLLLVITFLLSVFMVAQFLLARQITGQDSALGQLRAQIAELTQLLALEKAAKADVESSPRRRCRTISPPRRTRTPISPSLLEGAGAKGDSASVTISGPADHARQGEGDLVRGAGQGRAAEPADRRHAPPAADAERAAQRCRNQEQGRRRRRSPISASGSIRRWPSACRS